MFWKTNKQSMVNLRLSVGYSNESIKFINDALLARVVLKNTPQNTP